MHKVKRFFFMVFAVVLIGIGCPQHGVAAPTSITILPFSEDFEQGVLPAEIEALSGTDSSVHVTSDAANKSGYGVMMEGNTSIGWGATPYSVTDAFDSSKASHISNLNMEITPNGSTGYLYLDFDFRQGYSFNINYSWFRVLVNGSPIQDVNGNAYYQPVTNTDGWKRLRYDLTPYLQDVSISVTLQASNKYYFQYYNEGDITMIDDLLITHYYLTDDDNIDDEWEILYFGDLNTADDTTDYDGDGYSDLQEFINQNNSETDPEGNAYDPMVINAPGGTGTTHPISTFPFEIDFEGGTLPAEIMARWAEESSVFVSPDAANNSGFGVMMEGNTYVGWYGDSTSTTYLGAYAENLTHISSLDMIIIPSGADENLVLKFNHRQNYTFGPAYSWFRVLVNGIPILDVDEKEYINPLSPNGDDWKSLQYDLTPYQNDASISVTLQASNKYYYNYQGSGNVSMIDNLRILYMRIGDEDKDGIEDDWEILYFGDLTTVNDTTDYDNDKYSDLQEFINQKNLETDPAGNIYNPKIKNVGGGTGHTRSSLWLLLTPVLLGNSQ